MLHSNKEKIGYILGKTKNFLSNTNAKLTIPIQYSRTNPSYSPAHVFITATLARIAFDLARWMDRIDGENADIWRKNIPHADVAATCGGAPEGRGGKITAA
ncbi:hypothetical protein [Roseomonas gilardii]|uniref:hypothetical protein n=1 Tax=Roseomonas gilardii TaxID=257708 RepID=UPI0011C05B04|nr:hypothetical protein [Roseomonas gilardii]